jgi:hypothetical protein
MAKIDNVIDKVNRNATTTVEELTSGYTEGCKTMVDMFLNLINPLIVAMTRALEILDGAKGTVDDAYDKFKDFPDLPSLPEVPPLTLPSFTIEDLNCPLAECFGLPGLPVLSSIEYDAGPPPEPQQSQFQMEDPENPGEYIDDVPAYDAAYSAWELEIEQWETNKEEYELKLGEFTDQVSTTVGMNAEILAKNAKKALMNTPQALLNGVVDGIRASIAGLVNIAALDSLDSLLDCLESKDPGFSKTEEVVRYRALRDELQTDTDGGFKIDGLSDKVINTLSEFKVKKFDLDEKIKAASELKQKGNGAVKLIQTNPLGAFKSLF